MAPKSPKSTKKTAKAPQKELLVDLLDNANHELSDDQKAAFIVSDQVQDVVGSLEYSESDNIQSVIAEIEVIFTKNPGTFRLDRYLNLRDISDLDDLGDAKPRSCFQTSLHLACKYDSHLPLVQYLVSKNADVHAADEEGETPLHWAARENCNNIVNFLIGASATQFVNFASLDGNTALHLAADTDAKESAKELLSQGADKNIKDQEGKLPLDIADDEEFKAILAEDWSQAKPAGASAKHASAPDSMDDLHLFLQDAELPDYYQTFKDAKVTRDLLLRAAEQPDAFQLFNYLGLETKGDALKMLLAARKLPPQAASKKRKSVNFE